MSACNISTSIRPLTEHDPAPYRAGKYYNFPPSYRGRVPARQIMKDKAKDFENIFPTHLLYAKPADGDSKMSAIKPATSLKHTEMVRWNL
jgi:hypothetical protein